jgi:hypothetical protein
VVLPAYTAEILGAFDEQDHPDAMESYLALPNTKYSDYSQDWCPVRELCGEDVMEGSPYLPQVALTIVHGGETVEVMHRSFPAPDISNVPNSQDSHRFLVSTADMDLPLAV